MKKEIWKYIPGFGEKYQVSNLGRMRRGRIRSNIRPPFSLLKGRIDKHGYLCVDIYLHEDGSFFRPRIHRLVLLAFRGRPQKGQMSRHLNDIKTDIRLENLCWGTKGDNHRDYYRNGGTRGFRNPKVLRKALKTRGVL